MEALHIEQATLRGPADRRDDTRPRTNLSGMAMFGAHVISCTILDVSPAGAHIKPANRYPLPERFELRIPGARVRELADVVWRKDDTVGIAFIG